MIIKNEAEFLEQFLEYHKELVDEIVIVDTESTDNSKEIAKKFTDKVYEFEWKDDFSIARNYSISKATKDWIIWLDVDERIDKKYFSEIRKLVEEQEKIEDVLGISLIQKNHTKVKNHPRFKNGYFIRRICKIFRNNKVIKFEFPVHETVFNSIKKLNGKIVKTYIEFDHFMEEKGKDFLIKKQKKYILLLEKKKEYNLGKADKEIETEKILLDAYKNL
jgi:glycosyltransferase involved in cell wall biosynthesis